MFVAAVLAAALTTAAVLRVRARHPLPAEQAEEASAQAEEALYRAVSRANAQLEGSLGLPPFRPTREQKRGRN
jgi:hypothetical protein